MNIDQGIQELIGEIYKRTGDLLQDTGLKSLQIKVIQT
jgi:hypothetical protein